MADQLGEHLRESLSPGGKWLEFPSFQGGCGTLYRNEIRRRLVDIFGFWFGDCDTFEDPWHLPVLATADTPTSITGSKTDYACMGEYYLGSWQVILVKGRYAWSTAGDAFGAAKKDAGAGAQGRQLLYVHSAGDDAYYLFWFCGAGAYAQATANGTTWSEIGVTVTRKYIDCGWRAFSTDTGEMFTYGIQSADKQVYYTRKVASGWITAGLKVPSATPTGPIPLGTLTNAGTAYVANGPDIWEIVEHAASTNLVLQDIIPTSLRDIKAACRHKDRFALTDGSDIIWFQPGQPEIHIPIWGKDGVPSDRAGSVKSLISIGDYLVALYELDAGGMLVCWGGPFNSQGDFPWCQRRVSKDDEFPLSVGSTLVLASQTYTASQRLWTVGADGAAGYAVRQDYPKRSYNPLCDPAMQYEDGPLHLYSPRIDLVRHGALLGAAREFFHLAELTSTETLAVAYRVFPFTQAESVDASWTTVTTLTELLEGIPLKKGGREGVPARQIQFRFTLNRGASVTATPKVHSKAVYCDTVPRKEHERTRRA
jgi:hypothetical protein